jgi:hypothetical protein
MSGRKEATKGGFTGVAVRVKGGQITIQKEDPPSLPDLAKKFKKCMEMKEGIALHNCDGCPLMGQVKLEIGAEGDEHGHIIWKIQACSLMAILDQFIEGKGKNLTPSDVNTNKELVTIWNKRYPPNTEVLLADDDGNIEHTRTTSEAWLLDSGQPVVKVYGRAGGYLLTRIKPIHPVGTPG